MLNNEFGTFFVDFLNIHYLGCKIKVNLQNIYKMYLIQYDMSHSLDCSACAFLRLPKISPTDPASALRLEDVVRALASSGAS